MEKVAHEAQVESNQLIRQPLLSPLAEEMWRDDGALKTDERPLWLPYKIRLQTPCHERCLPSAAERMKHKNSPITEGHTGLRVEPSRSSRGAKIVTRKPARAQQLVHGGEEKS